MAWGNGGYVCALGVGGTESDVDLMSPLSPPGGVKRALSVGAPAAMSMSLRTVTSMIEEPLEPPPKGPRTDGERETMSQALKAVASHAASVCPVRVSGISGYRRIATGRHPGDQWLTHHLYNLADEA